MLSFLPKASSTTLSILDVLIFESARAGTYLVVLALIAEYVIPGSVLASAPLFIGITVVALLCLLTPIPERNVGSHENTYARWKWLLPSLCFVGMIGLAVRDQDGWTWMVTLLWLMVLLAVVWTLAYDERCE